METSETKPLCKALNRKNESCGNYPMKGSKYCYQHSLGKIQGVVWWRNQTFHWISGIILAMVFFGFQCCTGGTLRNQERMLMKQNDSKIKDETNFQLASTNAKLVDENQHLKRQLEKYAQKHDPDKKKTFVGISRQTMKIIGTTGRLPKGTFIKWDDSKVTKTAKGNILIIFPTISLESPSRIISNCSLEIKPIFPYSRSLSLGAGQHLIIHVVEVTEDLIIVLLRIE